MILESLQQNEDRLIIDTKESLDRRWFRAHQYLTRIGKYKFRESPARTLFGLLVHLLRQIFEKQKQGG